MQDYIRGMILSAIGDWFRSLAAQVVNTLGIGGIIGVLAGCVLLLTLSAKATRFITSKPGMAITTLVLLVAIWFAWQVRTPSQTTPVVASSPVSKPAAAVMPMPPVAMLAKQDADPEPLIEVVEEEPPAPAAKQRRSPSPELLLDGIILSGEAGGMLMMPPATRTNFPMPLVRPPLMIQHHPAGKHTAHHKVNVVVAPPPSGGHASATTPPGHNRAAGSVSPSAGNTATATPAHRMSAGGRPAIAAHSVGHGQSPGHTSSSGGSMVSGNSGPVESPRSTPSRGLSAAQQARLANRQAIHARNQQAIQEMDSMLGSIIQGGMHPDHFGGMHPGHPAAAGGHHMGHAPHVTHPMGGGHAAPHMGAHRR